MRRGFLWFLLHILIVIFSLSSVCSKIASQNKFLSPKWFLFYGLVLFILMFYAVAWQQIIKRMPLSTAYANKAATVVWGQIWGLIIFHEGITPGKAIGALLIIIGIVMHAMASAEADRPPMPPAPGPIPDGPGTGAETRQKKDGRVMPREKKEADV